MSRHNNTFVDADGQLWTVRIDADSIEAVKRDEGVDLAAMGPHGLPTVAHLHANVEQLVDILHALCKSQADARGMTPAEFGRLMAGENDGEITLISAFTAMLNSAIDYFPADVANRLRRAKTLSKGTRNHV